MRRTRPWQVRFFEKVDLSGDCWVWTGARTAGYGTLFRNGRHERASRLAWEIATGSPPPPDLLVCHHCDNPPCVRPSHLFLGTDRDNAQDAISKGRVRGGAPARLMVCRSGRHALTDANLRTSKKGRRCRSCYNAAERIRRAGLRGVRAA